MKLKFFLILFILLFVIFYPDISFAQSFTDSRTIWDHIGSPAIPIPNGGNQQTASLILDIDRDGINDFVITERSRSLAVVWYKKSGTGWEKKTIEPGGLNIEAGGAYADIDSDGDLDIVFGQDSSGNQMWWWENPYPNFSNPWPRYTIKNSGGSKHHDQMFADIDGDGALELITWNQRSSQLLMFEIPTDPTSSPWPFQEIFNWTSGAEREGVAFADIDGDGLQDIIGAGSWFTYVSGGTFQEHIVDSTMRFTRSAAGQFIPGGRPELLFVCGDCDGPLKFYWWENNTWQSKNLITNVVHGHSISVGDIDRDGNLDIFVGEMGFSGSPQTYFLYGDGAGNFTVTTLNTVQKQHESKLGDLDGDGDLDLLAKPYQEVGVSVYVNQTPITLPLDQWAKHSLGTMQANAVVIKHADIDRDGNTDLVAGKWWYKNPGALGGIWTQNTIGSPLNNAIILHDFDNDGDTDIFGTQGSGSSSNHNFAWAENNGNGSFAIHTNISTGGSGDFVQGVVLGDFGQGKQIVMSWHNGGGGVQAVTVPVDPKTQTWPFSTISTTTQEEDISVADIDRDGDLDLLLGTIWLQNSGGTWSAHTVGSVVNGVPDRSDLIDINSDGRLDAVVALEGSMNVYWFEAPVDRTQSWTPHIIGTSEGQGFSMDVSDMDRDGDIDVILGEHQNEQQNGNPNRVFIFENSNNGTSWIRYVIDTDSAIDHHDGTQVADLDNDGDLDIYSIGWYNKNITVYENRAIVGGSVQPTPTPFAGTPTITPTGLPTSIPRLLNPVAHWKFDERNETVDSSGNNNILQLNNAIWSSSGHTGGAVSFNGGQNSYADVDDSPSLDIKGTQLTVEAWVNRASANDWAQVLSKIVQAGAHNSPYFSYSLHMNANNQVRFYVTTDTGSSYVLSSNAISLNTWTHIAGTYDGSTIKIYINGIERGSAGKSGNLNSYPLEPLRLGSNGVGSETFDGLLDDVRIYDIALTPLEIQNDMNNITPTPSLKPGDSNNDTYVDSIDLNTLITNFNQASAIWNEGDFDQNGVINILDLSILLSNFGR